MPGNHLDRVFFARVAINLIAGLAQIVYLNVAVLTARQEPIAINRVPAHAADHIVRCCDLVPTLTASPRVPNLNRLILAACDNERHHWVPLTRLHVVFVLSERELLLCRCKVENLCSVVLRAGDKLHAAWCKREVVDLSSRMRSEFILLA